MCTLSAGGMIGEQRTRPRVSIIVPCYKSAKTIRRCIDSIQSQTYRDFEVLFMVDCPELDNTPQIIKGYNDPRFRIITNSLKTKPSAARNRGYWFALSRHYITFLDSDDYWRLTRLEHLVRIMDTCPYKQWVWHYIAHVDSRGRTFWIDRRYPGKDVTACSVTGMLMRKSLLRDMTEIYGFVFDPAMDRSDDADFAWRIRDFPAISLPVVLAYYYDNPEGLSRNTDGIRAEKIYIKSIIRAGAWFALPHHLYNIALNYINVMFDIDLVKLKDTILREMAK